MNVVSSKIRMAASLVSVILIMLSTACISKLVSDGWSGVWWRDLTAVLGFIVTGPATLFALWYTPSLLLCRLFATLCNVCLAAFAVEGILDVLYTWEDREHSDIRIFALLLFVFFVAASAINVLALFQARRAKHSTTTNGAT